MTGFGERLKRLRKENDVTQAKLAEYIGVVPSAIGKYECVPDSYPSVDALVRISEYFNVSTDYLLKGTDPSPFIRNNINGSMSNSSLVQTSNGTVLCSGNTAAISPEAMELLRIYESLAGRERLQLLNNAIELERGAKE